MTNENPEVSQFGELVIGSMESGRRNQSIEIAESMLAGIDESEDGHQWVVYVLGPRARILPYFLAVCESSEEAKEEMDRWWLAFENGEKEKPKLYEGVSYGPVSSFDEWKEGDS